VPIIVGMHYRQCGRRGGSAIGADYASDHRAGIPAQCYGAAEELGYIQFWETSRGVDFPEGWYARGL